MLLQFVLVFMASHAIALTTGQTCSWSRQCDPGQCCRDPVTNKPLVDDRESYLAYLGQASGVCVEGFAGHHEQCGSNCDCQPGYECYRPLTGVCCAPRTCWTTAEAEAARQRWRCSPALPNKRRRSPSSSSYRLFPLLCPALPMVSFPAKPQPVLNLE